MERTFSKECVGKIGEEVRLLGWVNSRRDLGKLVFIDLRDRSGIVQIVCGKETKEVKVEDVIAVEGTVVERSKTAINTQLDTGTIEIRVSKVEVISKSRTLPFDIYGDGREIDEALRLDHRYLDLRRPRLVKNLNLRHKVIKFIRNYLDEKGFIEIETPILTKATPEGARDFIVPSRLQRGKFYALPQSPQQYKQLLMVAGFEKYYQIARCFRDEDPRSDRAYGEFTQLDIEMSFVTQEDILNLTESLMIELVEKVVGKEIYQKPFPRFSQKEAFKKFGDDKFDFREKKNPDILAFAWVLDFPLFERTETKEITPSHHPFTAPKDEDIALLDSEPMKVRSWQHDLVCNGYEVGGGSLRITNPKIQKKIFEILGLSEAEIEKKFGHLIQAFEYSVPPHGGIAPGVERLMMVFAGEGNTREVMAFPMTSSGQTAVMEAPSEISPEQLKEVGIRLSD